MKNDSKHEVTIVIDIVCFFKVGNNLIDGPVRNNYGPVRKIYGPIRINYGTVLKDNEMQNTYNGAIFNL